MRRIFVFSVLLALLAVMVLGAAAFAAKGTPTPALTNQEILDLQFVREEEKLARDVYIMMYEKWDLRIFDNIKASEQQHMDAIATLLIRYGVPDPATDAVGEFTNAYLQELYDDLIDKGNKSKVDALEVGVIIEETDIADLTECLQNTEKRDITQVYTNLMDGSYNHLAAFNSQLSR